MFQLFCLYLQRQNYMSGTKEEAAAISGYFCALSRKGGA